MANVLLVAYLLIVLALIVVILIQRSEGGALGIGGGGGGGLMTARGSANLLTRTTAILATLFFASAIGLTVLNELDRGTSGILENAASGTAGEQPSTVLDALNALQGDETSDLPLPADNTAAPAADSTSTTTTTSPASDLPVPEAPAADAAASQEQTPAAPAGN